MKKKLYIIYTNRNIYPEYGYYFDLFKAVKDFVRYMTINNFKTYKYPSLFWSIRKFIRGKDPFGYWTRYRRWEESLGSKRYLTLKFKTLKWILYEIRNK